MELTVIKSVFADTRYEQRRIFIIPADDYEFTFQLHLVPDKPPILSIPDEDGRMKADEYEQHIAWVEKSMNHVQGLQQAWSGLWEVKTTEAQRSVEHVLATYGFLSRLSLTFTPCNLPDIAALLDINQNNPFSEQIFFRFTSLPGFEKTAAEIIELFVSHTYGSSVFEIGCYLYNTHWTPPFTTCPWFVGVMRGLIDGNVVDYASEKVKNLEYQLELKDLVHIKKHIQGVERGLFHDITVTLDFRIKRLLDEGSRVYREGNLEKALDIYMKANSEYPGSPEVAFNYGIVADRLGKKEEAMKMWEEAIARDRHYYKAIVNLSSLLFESGNHEEAGILVTRGLSILPPDWIRDRMVAIKSEIERIILESIAQRKMHIMSGLDNAPGLERFRSYISALTGVRCRTCESAVLKNGTVQYNLITDDDVFRVYLEDNNLVINSDRSAKTVFQFSLPER